jgi:hypothetical protein
MKLSSKLLTSLCAVTGVISLNGCGSASSTGVTVSTKLTNLAISGTAAQLFLDPIQELLKGGGLTTFTAGDSASSTSSSVTSLKYIFGTMSLCQDVVTNGSAFTSSTGCITLYDSGIGDPSTITASTFTSFTKTIDLMDTASLTTFNAAATGTVTAGSYKYVTVNWSPYIGVTGSVVVGATTVRTQACTVNATTGLCKSSTSMSGASSNVQSIVKSANGGSWFKFQNPFVITDADVTAKTAYSVDLAFNPTGAIAANTTLSQSGGFYSGSISDVDPGVSGNTIYVPMISLTPVPRKTTETTSKETYNLTLPGTPSQGTTRVELYYNKADTAKTIYGVNILTLLTTSTNGSVTQIDNGAKIATITTDAAGAVTLKGSDGTAVITGLTRSASGTVTANVLGGLTSAATGVVSTYVDTVDLK